MDFVKKYKTEIGIFTITACLLFHVFIRGLNPQDEGWVLYGAWRIFQGDIPYRDFQYLYTPLTAFLGTLSFSLFGVSILAERILALFIASFTTVFLAKTLYLMDVPRKFLIGIVIFFLIWGPLQTNYLSPTLISIELGIIYSYFVLKGLKSKKMKNGNKLFFAAGITAALILLSKQNFGFMVFLHVFILLLYLLKSKKPKHALFLVLGILGIFTAMLAYLLTTSSFTAFLSEMYSFLIIESIAEHGPSYANAWTYPAPLFYKIGKIAFYSMPLFVSLLAAFMAIKKRSILFFAALLSSLFYLVGFQPTMDTIHITPLIALSSLSIGSLYILWDYKFTGKILTGPIIILLILGIYNGIFRNYYKWFAPLYTSDTLLTSSRARILVHPSDAAIFNTTAKYLSNSTKADDSIFNYGMTPILYFLSERKSPSRFNTIETRNGEGKNLKILLQELSQNSPTLIIVDGELRGINPTIESFILQRYTLDTTISGRLVFKITQ